MGKRKYPEMVRARMFRFDDGVTVHLFRDETRIQFGDSDHLIGSALMTNPGDYGLKNHKDWQIFKSGRGEFVDGKHTTLLGELRKKGEEMKILDCNVHNEA